MLQQHLTDIEADTQQEFDDENYDIDAFQRMCFDYPVNSIPASLLNQTPLAQFENQIVTLMSLTNFPYKLDRIGIFNVECGEAFLAAYSLCWYDGGLFSRSFKFETPC